MPSPFPGMNPYFERRAMWQDFHSSLIPRLRVALTPQVLPKYFVRVQEHLFFREMPDQPWRAAGVPDVSLVGGPGQLSPAAGSGTVVVAPAVVRLTVPTVEEVRAPYLEIVDRDHERVVTVLELLSPANKYAGADRDAYLVKRTRFLDAGVNCVEIDLLRGGPRTSPDIPPCDYCVMVARAPTLPAAGVWPFRLADPFPPVAVPLRAGEPEAALDLKTVIDALYDESGYAYFAYRGDPEPALTAEQAAWAVGFVPPAAP